MKKESKQSPKPKPKKIQATASQSITIRVPIDAFKTLRKLAADSEMTVNALLNFYIQQIVNQEATEAPVLADPSNSLISSGKQEAFSQERISLMRGEGFKYEKFDISSTSFVRVYFKNFILSAIICILVSPLITLFILISPLQFFL